MKEPIKINNRTTLHNEDCLAVMRSYPENTFTSVVTDPPYGLALLGNKWDYQVPSVEMFEEMLRVTKPGGLLLCFGGSRTFHRMAVNLEDAGWYIRDVLMWMYSSGFPKSYNVALGIDKKKGLMGVRGRGGIKDGKIIENPDIGLGEYSSISEEGSQFNGYGTALKPAYEPIILAMKPNDGSFVNNALTHKVAGLNIKACRIPSSPVAINVYKQPSYLVGVPKKGSSEAYFNTSGRWPPNVILGHHDDCRKIKGTEKWKCVEDCVCAVLDDQSGNITSGSIVNCKLGYFGIESQGKINFEGYQDEGGASRFFYCSKPGKKEKGLYNNHPTVKPLDLMEYLVGLVEMPNDVTHILDPFAGSGSTLLASMRKNIRVTGCELDPHYVNIIQKRLDPNFAFQALEYEEVSEEEEDDIFDFFGEKDE